MWGRTVEKYTIVDANGFYDVLDKHHEFVAAFRTREWARTFIELMTKEPRVDEAA